MADASVSALILAGGRATRLGGIDKRLIEIDGRTIFDRQVTVLAPLVSEVLVSAPSPIAGFRTVADASENIGPLAGIAAGVGACVTAWLVVVAGDMPYLTAPVIDALLTRCSDEVDAIGIRIDDLIEPLLCVLRCRPCRPVIERRIAASDYKASRLLEDPALRVTWLANHDLAVADRDWRRALFNVNSPAQLPSG